MTSVRGDVTCPGCLKARSKVTDSRRAIVLAGPNGERIRRNRTCLACGHRYTTLEMGVIDYETLIDNRATTMRDLKIQLYQDALERLHAND